MQSATAYYYLLPANAVCNCFASHFLVPVWNSMSTWRLPNN